MGSYTPNKNLYKADPATDGKDTFNITKMLNENWDKLDADIRELTFDALAEQYGVTESYPDADTGTITATIDDSAPVTAQRKTVVSKTSSGDLKFVETTTIDEVSTVTETTEGSTATIGDTAGQLNLNTIRWRLKRLQTAINSLAGEVSDTIDTSLAALEGDVTALEGRMDTAETDIAGLEAEAEAQGKRWAAYWPYLAAQHKSVTVPSVNDQKEEVWTQTLYDSEGGVVGTCVSTEKVNGSYTTAYTIGTGPTRTLTSTEDENGTWTEVWT